MRTFMVNYIENGPDGLPILLISEQRHRGWESIRTITGQDARETLETLLHSERDEFDE